MTKLESKLPEHYNGVEEIIATLLEKPKELQVAIILFKTSKITTDVESSDREPTIKIKRIEPVFGDDRKLVEDIYFRIYGERTGEEALPFDKELDAKINGTSALTLDEVALPPIIATHTAQLVSEDGSKQTLQVAEVNDLDTFTVSYVDIATNTSYAKDALTNIKVKAKKRALKAVPETEFSEVTE